MIVFWTILHGIVAIALLGAVTHQCLSLWRRPAPAKHFVNRFRAVAAERFTSAICVLFVITFAIGAYVYPVYVLDVKASLIDSGLRKTIGVFQLKEHLASIGLGLLPVYWHFWRSVPRSEAVLTRKFLTTFLALSVWWNLVIGHVLNNVKGLL